MNKWICAVAVAALLPTAAFGMEFKLPGAPEQRPSPGVDVTDSFGMPDSPGAATLPQTLPEEPENAVGFRPGNGTDLYMNPNAAPAPGMAPILRRRGRPPVPEPVTRSWRHPLLRKCCPRLLQQFERRLRTPNQLRPTADGKDPNDGGRRNDHLRTPEGAAKVG